MELILALSAKLAASMLQTVLNQLTSPAIKEVGKIWNVDKQLKELLATYEKIKAVLDKCNDNFNGSSVLEAWLQELEGYCYDTEDLVDDLTLSCPPRGNDEKPLKKPIRRKFTNSFSTKRVSIPHKIVELRIKLERRYVWIEDFLKASSRPLIVQEEVSVVSSLSDETPLVSGTSRDGDKQWIMKLLKQNGSGVSIVGIDGLGKSALARMVLADDFITGEFPLVLCAVVSGHFQLGDVVQKLVASKEANTESHQQSAQPLREILRGQKALIILDDVWSVTVEDWEKFEHNFLNLSDCWKILATTCNPNVAVVTGTTPYSLKGMTDEDCKHLIMGKAKLSESDCVTWAEDVEEIAKRCKGLPIIASKFGLTLSTARSVDDRIATFRRFKSKNLMQLPEFMDVFPCLMLNKPQLSPHLKRCFAYCSLFSPDHKFQKDHLIQFWEAEGFVQPQTNRDYSHSSGSKCFDDLLSRSILRRLETSNEKQPAYEMQDFNREIAEILASKTFLRIDQGTEKFLSACERIRHFSLTCQNADVPLLEQIKKCTRLRTFLLLHLHVPKKRNISYDTFRKLETLRLLDLSHTNISILKPVSSLKHLRYLDLSDSDIHKLPDPISPFFRALQILKLKNCSKLNELPKDLNKLIRLRQLHVNMQLLTILPKKLGMLTNLECLGSYIVGKTEGNKVAELRNMKYLREICISGLENVSCGKEAQESMLETKKWLSKLALEWDSSNTQEMNAADVLEGLEPHTDLTDLTIRNYPCQTFPAWITSLSRKLVGIYLENCLEFKSLPPLGQLPLLRSLVIHSFGNVEIVDRRFFGQGETRFPSLESLEFKDMKNLLYWIGLDVGDMPCLRHLKITECPRLRYLPPLNHQVGLIKLEIKSCSKLKSLPELSPSLNGEHREVIIKHSPLIEERCPNLSSSSQ